MKISIGSKIIEGPYGGGNEYLLNLKNSLEKHGHTVVHDLKDKDLDFIFLTNPLMNSETSTFDNFDIEFYLKFRNAKAITLHRINECDERKNTNFVNKRIIKASKNIDSRIFVSNWLKNLYETQGISQKNNITLLGGPNSEVFNNVDKEKWNGSEKLKIITHHWSSNPMKGFEIYKKLDDLISSERWKNKIEFTYIGNLPRDFKLYNSNVFPAMDKENLSEELKKHHIYITASINEPSGNHHMEAGLSRLPILHLNSGALPEYCNNFGVSFDVDNFEYKLEEIIEKYSFYFDQLQNYNFDFNNSFSTLINHLYYLDSNKTFIIEDRNPYSNIKFILYYIPHKFKKKLYTTFISLYKTLLKIFNKI